MEDHLEEEIAQLFLEGSGATGLDGFQDFVRLLDQVRLQGSPRLLAVPRTAVGCTKAQHDVQEPFEEYARGLGHVGS